MLFKSTNYIRISLFILVLNFDLDVVHEECAAILSDLIDNSHIGGAVGAASQVLQALWLFLFSLSRVGGSLGDWWVLAGAGTV